VGKRSRVEGDKRILSTLRLRRGGHCRFGIHRQQNSPATRSGVTALISLRVFLHSFQPFKRPTFRQVEQPLLTFVDMLASCRLQLWRHWLEQERGMDAGREEKWAWLLEYLATAS
jgi:hypothetical protein